MHRTIIEGVPPLLFQGTLLDDLQNPINNAQIQFWQTDPRGIYNHPDAAGSVSLEPTFQYCGTAQTVDDGSFWFMTHRPGVYVGRPSHFHYKVWLDGQEMLTSQFYFADENTGYSDLQVVQLTEYEFDNGLSGYVTNKTIVLDRNRGGDGPFTPSDMEGPFYPVFDFFEYGNDMITMSSSHSSPSPSATDVPTTTESTTVLVPTIGSDLKSTILPTHSQLDASESMAETAIETSAGTFRASQRAFSPVLFLLVATWLSCT